MTTSIYVGIPTRGHPHVEFQAGLHAACASLADQIRGIFYTKREPCAFARNIICSEFLQSGCTHLWFVDDDTVVQPDALAKLLALDADIGTGITPFFVPTGMVANVQTEPNVFLPWRPSGVFPVIRAGTSCMLLKRHVLADLIADDRDVLFSYLQTKDGLHSCSEDMPFCDRVRDLGYSLQCDASVICEHRKEIGLAELWEHPERFANK